MQSRLAKFFQELAVNPLNATKFADPAQREQFILEAGLSTQEQALLCATDADALHNLIGQQCGAHGENWSNLQTNQNNNTNDVTRFKRRSKISA